MLILDSLQYCTVQDVGAVEVLHAGRDVQQRLVQLHQIHPAICLVAQHVKVQPFLKRPPSRDTNVSPNSAQRRTPVYTPCILDCLGRSNLELHGA